MKPRLKHLRLAFLCVAALTNGGLRGETASRAPSARPGSASGEFGGDMTFLRSFYTAPGSGEGNHYVEMWKPGAGIREITRAFGLTRNRALFVNSHGDAVSTARGSRYGFHPHETRISNMEPAPSYSVRDLFTLIGPAAAADIHNICISGCNTEGLLKAGELRQFFPNATNITHVGAGDSGFEPMFIQALTLPSADIRPLFETAQKKGTGEMAYSLGHTSAPNALRLPPYIAELFLPGAKKPFKTRVAGRDLLDPMPARLLKSPQ